MSACRRSWRRCGSVLGSSACERSIIGIAVNEVAMMLDGYPRSPNLQAFSRADSALVFDGDIPDLSLSMCY